MWQPHRISRTHVGLSCATQSTTVPADRVEGGRHSPPSILVEHVPEGGHVLLARPLGMETAMPEDHIDRLTQVQAMVRRDEDEPVAQREDRTRNRAVLGPKT